MKGPKLKEGGHLPPSPLVVPPGIQDTSPKPSPCSCAPKAMEGAKTCSICHHIYSAHYDENGKARECVVQGCRCSAALPIGGRG